MKKKVLFICTHNSACSQMAEGFLSALCGDRYEGSSAGTEPTEVNPYAVKAMAELELTFQRSVQRASKAFGKRISTMSLRSVTT